MRNTQDVPLSLMNLTEYDSMTCRMLPVLLVQVHCLDLYKQKWPKTLVWVHDLDLYKHLTDFGGRRPTEGGGQSPAGESFPPGGSRVSAGVKEAKPPLLNKKASPERLACLVDQTLRISNLSFIEGLLQIQAFIDRLDR